MQLARHELVVAFRNARLREALERESGELTAVVDGTTDLIVQVDAERRVVRLNPAGERLLGIDGRRRAGQDVRRCAGLRRRRRPRGGCLPTPRGHDDPPADAVSRDGRSGARMAVRSGSPAGTRRWQGLGPTAGHPRARAQATAIVRDISAIRALEELREGFVATVSHELRTPLSLIRGYAETLLHIELEPSEQRDYLERIDEVSGRLSALVGQILDVTHLQADPLILERGPRAVHLARHPAARRPRDLGRSDRLVIDLPADLPPIEVDAARVGQILENLVENAFKYGPSDGLVAISAQIDGEWLAVAVDDQGVGIPATERALVTEPFHRAWNVRESRIPGTGLGLYICRRLVEAHGGRLWLEDRPDGRAGTRVLFTLPLLRGRRQTACDTRRRPDPSHPAEVDGG